MTQSTVFLLVIILATLVVLFSVVVSLIRESKPTPSRRAAAGVPVKILCPITGDFARVGIGLDSLSGALAVVWCERFATGVFECGRECFPMLDEARTPEATAPAA